MAIPSGSGTEVLKRAYIAAMTNSPQKIIDGVANHIYTLLTMQVTNHSGSATNVMDIYIDPEGTTEKAFLAKQIILNTV